MEQELAYSFHLGSDKNKSKVAKKTAKGNVSGTTSLSNNAIQNANDLSRANKHNLRDYDNQRELITTIYGTNDIVEDVKQVYLDEFEEARIEFNNKQTRNDRKINNYFEKACTLQNDIACEIIIELGDTDFWQDKDDDIKELKDELSAKDKTIIKLNSALEKAKTELSKFKGFWKSLIKRFQMKIFDEKYYDIPEDKRSYTLVAEDLEKSGIFDNNDSDIVHNPTRKVLTNDELAEIQAKKGKKKNDYNLD